jgi:hypothetical protein
MQLEAATKEILAILLGDGKEFERMDPVVRERFNYAIDILLSIGSVADLRFFGKFNFKSFNNQYQINVTPEKRMRFTADGNTVTIAFFGSTTHKGE